jgi:ribonuclease PH
MFDIQTEELIWGGRKLTLETGKVARQADGSVMVTYGETVLLATVVSAKEPKPGIDFVATAKVASGVTSRRAGPVPPVVSTKSQPTSSTRAISVFSMVA